jgi:hypothetical protein
LHISCFHGPANGTVYFHVYPTLRAQEDMAQAAPLPVRQDTGWGVSATTPATADELLKIL